MREQAYGEESFGKADSISAAAQIAALLMRIEILEGAIRTALPALRSGSKSTRTRAIRVLESVLLEGP